MKSIASLFCLVVLSSYAMAQEQLSVPPKLLCVAQGDCVKGLDNFCAAAQYFPTTIDETLDHIVTAYDPSGTLSKAELQTRLMIDFFDGDQYSFYLFDAQEMSQLARGLAKNVHGTYEDGFDWVNGYNTRARFNIECSVVN